MAPESADRTLVSIASATYPQISCPLCDRWALAWTAGAELPGGLIVGHDPAPAPAACFRLRIALDRKPSRPGPARGRESGRLDTGGAPFRRPGLYLQPLSRIAASVVADIRLCDGNLDRKSTRLNSSH